MFLHRLHKKREQFTTYLSFYFFLHHHSFLLFFVAHRPVQPSPQKEGSRGRGQEEGRRAERRSAEEGEGRKGGRSILYPFIASACSEPNLGNELSTPTASQSLKAILVRCQEDSDEEVSRNYLPHLGDSLNQRPPCSGPWLVGSTRTSRQDLDLCVSSRWALLLHPQPLPHLTC